jgi:hypothetical protein
MAEYILYCFEGTGIVRCESLTADSDEAAITESLRLQGSHAAELWCGARRVMTFAPISTPQAPPPASV